MLRDGAPRHRKTIVALGSITSADPGAYAPPMLPLLRCSAPGLAVLAALTACGGETHDLPPVVPVPAPTASLVIPVEAATPEAPPVHVSIKMVDPSVRLSLGAPREVKLDARALKLPPALRAHLARQARDGEAIGALTERRWEATERRGSCADPCRNGPALEKATADAQGKVDLAVQQYDAWASAAIAELAGAVAAPGATVDVAMAQALFLRGHETLHYRASMNLQTCDRSLDEDLALRPCGEDDPRIGAAFARAAELSTARDPLGALARLGVAETTTPKQARHALEEVRDASTGAARGPVLADLAVACAAGAEPDLAGAARALRELRDVLEADAQAAAARPHPKPPARPRRRGPLGPVMFGDAVGEPDGGLEGLSLGFSPADAAGALRFLVYVEAHAQHDRECLQAGIDLAGRGGELPHAVVHLLADAVERSDDAGLLKAPSSLAVPVLEELATRALYRGDAEAAMRWATQAVKLGGAKRAPRILAAAQQAASLPEDGSHMRVTFPDDIELATTHRGGPERRVASLARLCLEPSGGSADLRACLSFTVRADSGHPTVDVGESPGLPAGVAECLRQRGPRVFASEPSGVAAEVALYPRGALTHGGVDDDAPPPRGEGIGMGSTGTLGHGAGSPSSPCHHEAVEGGAP